MLDTPAPGTPYHRLARTGRHRWWRPLVGTLALLGVTLLAGCGLFGVAAGVGELTGRAVDPDGLPVFGPVADAALLIASVAVALPVTLAVARLLQRRPAGTLSSVTGRLRRRWLGVCLLVSAGAVAVLVVGADLLLRVTGADDTLVGAAPDWVGWPTFAAGLAVIVLLVPFQAAAEEYVFRGWLSQAFGVWLRSPWPGLVAQAVLFAAAHGWGTAWGFAGLFAMGAVAGWLTVRTGGLEAAVALHVVNNVVAFGLAAAFGGLDSAETMADAPWQFLAVDLLVLAGYAIVVTRLAGRLRIATVTPAGPVGPASAPAGGPAARVEPAAGPLETRVS